MLLDGGSSRYQVYDPIALIVQVAQERGHHSCRPPRPRIKQQNDSLLGDLELLDHFFNSCSGVMFSQSAAQRSSPKTRMPRDCRRSSAAGVESK